MLGGPAMNVLIAAVLAGAVLMIYGNPTEPELRPVVSEVSACVVPVADGNRPCTSTDPGDAGCRGGVPARR